MPLLQSDLTFTEIERFAFVSSYFPLDPLRSESAFTGLFYNLLYGQKRPSWGIRGPRFQWTCVRCSTVIGKKGLKFTMLKLNYFLNINPTVGLRTHELNDAATYRC